MPVTRSEEYYFPRDNLVIQVEDTLFRLHSGTLELHSGFFRDMFVAPSNDPQEGTSDEHPLRLPPDLCSAESFTTLCRFICPKIVGDFPRVLVEEYAKWDPVLNATEALQMTDTQAYILDRLEENSAHIKTGAVGILSWALRSERPRKDLERGCYIALAYRLRPLSPAEMDLLGWKVSAQVVRVRERIRLLFSNPTSVESLKPHIPTDKSCRRYSTCRSIIFKQFLSNLSADYPPSDLVQQNDFDIFQVLPREVPKACDSCGSQSNLDKISSSLRKAKLDEEVQRYVRGEWFTQRCT